MRDPIDQEAIDELWEAIEQSPKIVKDWIFTLMRRIDEQEALLEKNNDPRK